MINRLPMPESPELTLIEVGNLPGRAAVAMAIRCALRTAPHFRIPPGLDDEGIWQSIWDASMKRADDFARGLNDSDAGLDMLIPSAYAMAEQTADFTQFAGYSAAHAVQTVAHVLAAAQENVGMRGMQVVASTYGACRVLLQKCRTVGREATLGALRSDLQALRAMPREKGLGSPIDASANGPLGELWPFGVPPEI